MSWPRKTSAGASAYSTIRKSTNDPGDEHHRLVATCAMGGAAAGRAGPHHGTTATTHILKPEIGKLSNGIDLAQSIENEHLCMRLTASFGLPTARTEMKEFSGKRVLAVERFDRRLTRDNRLLRLPQEDCCQALSIPPTRKMNPTVAPVSGKSLSS
jgi:serine/threonine protein kinase HipA of HipAB toxin-antitoxin module